MRHYRIGQGKWVFVDWMGVEPGYGTQWGGDLSHGFCVPNGIQLKVHHPSIDPAAVIRADKPWENAGIGLYCTFMADQDTLRYWYAGERTGGDWTRRAICYAQSDDGVHWVKPELGLVEFDGSKANNILRGVGDGFENSPEGACVFKDPSADPAERYKMVWGHWTDAPQERCIKAAISPDGLQWTPLDEPILFQHGDTQNVCLWDEDIGKYVLYTRQRDGVMKRRGLNRSESEDFRNFPPSEPIFEACPTDPPDWDFYCNGYSRWPGAVDAHLMQIAMYERTPDLVNVHLATSRDGRTWHRPLGRQPWIDNSQGSSLSHPSIYPCSGIIPTAPGEWSTYLAAFMQPHNAKPDSSPEDGIFRAVMREDGFVSLSARGRGEFWTIPFTLNSDEIRMNVRTGYSGFIRCEVLAAGSGGTGAAVTIGKAIEGFGLEDCESVAGDEIAAPLTWKSGADLKALRGQSVRLRFDMYKADLFAIRF